MKPFIIAVVLLVVVLIEISEINSQSTPFEKGIADFAIKEFGPDAKTCLQEKCAEPKKNKKNHCKRTCRKKCEKTPKMGFDKSLMSGFCYAAVEAICQKEKAICVEK